MSRCCDRLVRGDLRCQHFPSSDRRPCCSRRPGTMSYRSNLLLWRTICSRSWERQSDLELRRLAPPGKMAAGSVGGEDRFGIRECRSPRMERRSSSSRSDTPRSASGSWGMAPRIRVSCAIHPAGGLLTSCFAIPPRVCGYEHLFAARRRIARSRRRAVPTRREPEQVTALVPESYAGIAPVAPGRLADRSREMAAASPERRTAWGEAGRRFIVRPRSRACAAARTVLLDRVVG